MNLVGLALRNLKRRPIRTCLSILGIGLAVGSAPRAASGHATAAPPRSEMNVN